MRLDGQRESSNIEDRRGEGGFGLGSGDQQLGGFGGRGGGGGLIGMLLPLILSKFGIGGVVVLGILYLVMGGLGGGGGQGVPSPVQSTPPPGAPAAASLTSGTDRFVAQVLGSTEDTWSTIFQERGQRYPAPKLVLFSGRISSACGSASSATGPFYCPGDRKVYLDTSFFDELGQRFGAPGDFAAAYVIAHEVGHHIQTVLGINEQVRKAQARASETAGNALQVKMELQADCLAGVWASRNRSLLDEGDFAEGVRAAEAIGDDTLQRQATGTVRPDSFTHGSSEQRVAWLTRGFQSGNMDSCDTFSAARL
ncbi:KPN_02809 family neutral zinc metallopeptidase [Sandaracinobacteroides saxicola]|uniref:Neutral zinc metallopeptidase n=1 Tax=Sandaracinobacteroides saxicola TaxID=2759707 RepID=A0A7G5ILW2_9SPHN|nr:neutral zinc metallopeptidase [Sandaracinobacteroides saxicola]QMW24354.1 neutral zinc metallopeptidase [Sandaracinobacteroides saxicola]